MTDLEQAEREALGRGGALQAVHDEEAAGSAGQGAPLREALQQHLHSVTNVALACNTCSNM